jgi:hypothetical protein
VAPANRGTGWMIPACLALRIIPKTLRIIFNFNLA